MVKTQKSKRSQGRYYTTRTILYIEIIGMVFVILLGSLLHFTFELSGGNPIVGSISAVNESTWEHLKLVFFPMVFFLGIEALLFRDIGENFFIAKAVAILVGIFGIIGLFYGYTAITGAENLIVDISIFMISVVLGYLASYYILVHISVDIIYEYIGIIIIITLGTLFIVFTFFPPEFFLFQDPSGGYGII